MKLSLPCVEHLYFSCDPTVGILYAPAAPQWGICNLTETKYLPVKYWGLGRGRAERAKIFHSIRWKILCLTNLLGLVKSLLSWSHRAARTIYVSLGVSRWINICNHNIPVSKLTRNEVIIYDRMYTWLSRLTWKSYLTGFPYKILFTSSSSFGGRCFSKQLSKLVNSAAIFYQVTQNDLDWPIVLGRVWDRKR